MIVAPISVLVLLIAFFAVIRMVSRNYIKVAPTQVLVIFGRKYNSPDGKGKQGFKLVTGGAAFVIPLLEKYQIMPLDVFQTKVQVKNVPSQDGVRVTVDAVATLKIGSEVELLNEAVKRLLNKRLPEIEQIAREVLEGGLRGVVATLSVEMLVRDRTSFGSKVQEEVAGDLSKIGIRVDNFVIQDIADELGYIDALGKKKTAEVKRDAAIGEADATRDQNIQVAEATRQADEKSSEARRIGETAKAKAAQAISDAERERDVKKAENQALSEAERAKIPIAAEIAQAEKDKQLRIARVAAEEAETIARTGLQLKERERRDAELNATVVVTAEREKEAQIIKAEATRESIIIEADGKKAAAERNAAAALITKQQDAEARKAQAAADQAEIEAKAKGNQSSLEAIAAGKKAELLAEAEGIKARLTAEAEGIQKKLVAEAEGVEKKALAYQKLDAAGKLMLILEALPEIIRETGEAVNKAGLGTLAPMAQAIGAGLAGIEEVRIYDMGSGKTGDGALRGFMNSLPETVFGIIQRARGMGLESVLAQVAEKAGIDLSSIEGFQHSLGKLTADQFPEKPAPEPQD